MSSSVQQGTGTRLSVAVRLATPGRVYEVDPGSLVLVRDERVVVETEHGVALATVVVPPRPAPENKPSEGRVVKKADARDLAREDANLQREKEAFRVCLEMIRARGVPMKLVKAEVPFEGNKVIFSFAAEGRIDFRELVRDLSQRLNMRAEMKQIGARDGAKLIGALGPCGRELCCASWLGTFQAVAVKMAKEQGLSLNPEKLAGMCGRLKCCLRYEYDTYLGLKRGLPRVGARVKSTRGDGRIVRHNPLRRTVVIKRHEDGIEVEVGLAELIGKCREAANGGDGGDGCCAAGGPPQQPANCGSRRRQPEGSRAGGREPRYLTTPIYYVNAEPHLGHTYTTVVADTLARFYRAQGRETFFLTGTDEHGDKIARTAAAAGVEPREYVDRMSGMFRKTWDACGISYDHFIRTTDPAHVALVQEVLAAVHRAGDIRFGAYTGRYCFGCERFYTERELVDGLCPDHREPPALISEENYFFRMSRYQERLRRLIMERPDLIVPEGYRNEVLGMLREPLEDLCISRPKSRLAWGIELPFDRRYVTYVWFDALFNYVSALRLRGQQTFSRLWPHATHVIAKDILKPHAIYWPTLLMAAGLPVFRRLCVHGYWIMEAGKMSKSLGNVIRPLELKERYGMDAVRYYLLREMAFGQDATFSEDVLVARINADLANGLGNLVSRVLAMQQRYFAGAVQPLGPVQRPDEKLRDAFARAAEEVAAHVETLAFHRALDALWRAIDEANRYIVETVPFKLARRPDGRARAGSVLHHLCEALRATAELLAPFMPETAERIGALLALDPQARGRPWGSAFGPGHRTRPPEVLFPRIDSARP